MPKRSLNLFVPTRTPSPRPHRVEKEIKRILSEIFQRQEVPPIWGEDDALIPFPGPLTVTDVKISADLRECTVFVMPLANHLADTLAPYFEHATPVIRKLFAGKASFRIVPNFRFVLDSSFATADKIEALLKNVRAREEAAAHEKSQTTDSAAQGEEGGDL